MRKGNPKAIRRARKAAGIEARRIQGPQAAHSSEAPVEKAGGDRRDQEDQSDPAENRNVSDTLGLREWVEEPGAEVWGIRRGENRLERRGVTAPLVRDGSIPQPSIRHPHEAVNGRCGQQHLDDKVREELRDRRIRAAGQQPESPHQPDDGQRESEVVDVKSGPESHESGQEKCPSPAGLLEEANDQQPDQWDRHRVRQRIVTSHPPHLGREEDDRRSDDRRIPVGKAKSLEDEEENQAAGQERRQDGQIQRSQGPA